MAETLNLILKAREIIVSPSHEALAIVVHQLYTRQESEEYKKARALFDFFVSNHLNCLTLKLLKLYQSTSNGVTRFRSIYLLSETLTDFKNRSFNFSIDSLYEIKLILISCLTSQETKESDIKILKRIVYFIAYNVLLLHNGKWDELGDCILSLTNSEEPVKAFHIFIDLPQVYKCFIDKFLHKILEKASNVFLDPKLDRVQDWSLALQTLVKMWIQLLNNTEMGFELVKALMEIRVSSAVSSVKKLMEKGKEQFLQRGLEDFERFFSREMDMYSYTKEQCHFVLALMNEIEGVVGTQSKEIVRKIKTLVTEPERYDEVKSHRRDEFYSSWYEYLMSLSSLEVLKIFASTDLEDRSRDVAIRRLNVLLSDHTSTKVLIDIAEMRELQPLLMSCLKEEGISDSMFKVLGEVVNHVAHEMFVNQQEKWYELRDYVVSRSRTEFQRGVYLFQCLTMTFVDDDFVTPVMEKLLPEISTRIDPPTELLVDNSCWVLAFTGAFCATIHLTDSVTVKAIAHMMIDCVRELVEGEMEVGLVRRAFRDVERIVKKQVEWYSTSEYKFLKGLLWELYTIKGMKWESKIVLWRINVIVERGVKETEKELPEDEFLNLKTLQ